MKLIDLNTGIEYEDCPHSTNYGCYLKATGKTYEKHEGYGLNEQLAAGITARQESWDTHHAICFLEPIEKQEPMPKLENGDCLDIGACLIYLVNYDLSYPNQISGLGFDFAYDKSLVNKIYRNGKLLWSKP